MAKRTLDADLGADADGERIAAKRRAPKGRAANVHTETITEEKSGLLFDLRRVGPRQNVMQIVPPRGSIRHSVRSERPVEELELLTQSLEAPTGPLGARNFRNVAGSQIAVPHVTNLYLGQFWGDQKRFEEFSRAIVENGYLDPLLQLGYGTGSGVYLGSAHASRPAGPAFSDEDARETIRSLLDKGTLHADEHTLIFLILPAGIPSKFSDGPSSCASFCGYHDTLTHERVDVAYAVLPAPESPDGGERDLDMFTATYAHGLAEACTDKIPGKGWVDDEGNENGDLEAWILMPWGPPSEPKRYVVQGYYTNERGNTIGAWRDRPLVVAAPVSAPSGPFAMSERALASARGTPVPLECDWKLIGGKWVWYCE